MALLAVHPVLAARDVAVSVEFYTRLGFVEVFRDRDDGPRYAAIRREGVELHLQWADEAQWVPGIDRPAIRLLVDDVDGVYAGWHTLLPASQGPWARPANTPWGTREFHFHDPGGNVMQVYAPLE